MDLFALTERMTVSHGLSQFMFADCVRLAILIAFPILSLWLPGMMK